MSKLSPTKQKIFNKKIFAFDIETANNNKEFVMGSIIGDNYQKVFKDPISFTEEVKTNKVFRNSVLFATNLGFDFFGIFFNSIEQSKFYTLFRGSDLLLAKTYFYNDNLYPKPNRPGKSKTQLKSITFLDSLNFAKLSVSKMGQIIGLNKIEAPDCLGKKPQSEKEWRQLTEYNIRDSQITYEFMKFLIPGMEELGATFKNTLASTAMALFKNKFLKEDYYQHEKEVLIEQFKSYYGGRTEALERGYFTDMNYYDFNSLYPSVMHDYEYPDPNTLRTNHKNTYDYIKEYEGCSDVELYIFPETKYPSIPVKTEEGRVLFPTGNIRGWYTHIEIREAISNGAVLKKVYKCHYYLKTCSPFKEFVSTLYNLRKVYKEQQSPMEYLVKILMNSLYGKFGQKFLEKDNWQHESTVTLKQIQKATKIETQGEFMRIVADSKPSAFCIPIWASYVSAYGRIKLHRAIVKYEPIYCDTDSIITKHEITESNELGQLKLEMKVKEGIVVRPKFYALVDADNNEYVKIKGLARRLNYFEFVGLLNCPLQLNGKTLPVKYEKFTKFKEALRRDLIPNEILQTSKEFSLEDEKRIWPSEFNPKVLQSSIPIELKN